MSSYTAALDIEREVYPATTCVTALRVNVPPCRQSSNPPLGGIVIRVPMLAFAESAWLEAPYTATTCQITLNGG